MGRHADCNALRCSAEARRQCELFIAEMADNRPNCDDAGVARKILIGRGLGGRRHPLLGQLEELAGPLVAVGFGVDAHEGLGAGRPHEQPVVVGQDDLEASIWIRFLISVPRIFLGSFLTSFVAQTALSGMARCRR